MVRIMDEPGWLVCPGFADRFVRREAAQGIQAAGEVVGGDKVAELLPELVGVGVVEALDGRALDRAAHPLDLAVVQGCRGLVRRCSMSRSAQAASTGWPRTGPFSARPLLIAA